MATRVKTFKPHLSSTAPALVSLGIFLSLAIAFTPQKASAANSTDGFVKTSGTKLMLNGKPFIPVGMNHMDVPTLWSTTSSLPGNKWITDADFASFRLAGFNSVRLAVKTDYFQSMLPPHAFSKAGFAWLDRIISMAKKNGIRLILDMHMPTGGEYQDYRVRPESQAFWEDPWAKGRYVDVWREIAKRYARENTIWAYDMMNEPATWDYDSYGRLMQHTAQAIRSYDTDHVLIVQPGMRMSVDHIATFAYPQLDDANVAHSIHYYEPLSFTHKDVYWGVLGEGMMAVYPSGIWNSAQVARSLEASASSARAGGYPAILTEFGTVFHQKQTGQVSWIEDMLKAAKTSGIGWHYWYYKGKSYIRELGLTIPGDVVRPKTWAALRTAARQP